MYTQSPLDKVAIFIDGENIHYSAKHLNMRLDYLKLCRRLAGKRRLLRAYFYTAISAQSEGKIDFINFLKLNGFTVVTREVKSFSEPDATNRSVRSALDMELAMDIVNLCPHVDTVILCSGDGDFRPLVEAVARRGKHVEVCALREMTSTDLIAAADVYVDLGSLKDEIALEYQPQREIRNEIDTSADGFEDFRVQDTTFDF
ncbi:MAG TPA: NYN domain-containing protein [Candidatus Krumholzibacteria bacterium]|nr:NYN domain-containing protein [Candidatus Krumholzibacteria bacterium]HPD71411.1 NYN domain-containing protein [Candidatus Krumholzibacteria bacterium]HRY41656.1 NYN domain-containing protein [Candidatus Krumholzibacteria bacterium]